MSDHRPCEYIPPFANSRWAVKGRAICIGLAEPGSHYCPAHRDGIERAAKPVPRVKHDLDLDVLPWSDSDATALNRTTRKRSLKQER